MAIQLFLMVAGWIAFCRGGGSSSSRLFSSIHETEIAPLSSLFSPQAYPVYGTHIEIEWKENSDQTKKQKKKTNGNNSISVGIVVLLHACTHNAFKFFEPDPTSCPSCVGLAEEERLSRLVLQRGYVALAVTCANAKSGCWGGAVDLARIRAAIAEVKTRVWGDNNDNDNVVVYVIGASSGGSMAAKLVVEGIARSGVVMVMGLANPILDQLLALPAAAPSSSSSSSSGATHKVYLAPMTRDKGTAQRNRANYRYVTNANEKSKSHLEMILDETSCVPLPVTPDYLWNRVPGMTLEAANVVVDVLIRHRHLDPHSHLLVKDPTRSNWRDFFLGVDDATHVLPKVPESLRRNNSPHTQTKTTEEDAASSTSKSMLLWGIFDLTPGRSPLAKALHRAWAFHEYCSEVVEPALDWFEAEE
eukprot:jgi/Psemu1/298773/fgenesh1_pm.735_\